MYIEDINAQMLPRFKGRLAGKRISDLPYYRKDLGGDKDLTKYTQQDKIVTHVEIYHASGVDVKVFCFPGLQWGFEKKLIKAYSDRKVTVVGIENVWSVISNGQPFMPGNNQVYQEWPMRNNRYISGISSSAGVIIQYDAEAFWKLDGNDIEDQNRFDKLFRKWTCAWIDPCNTISGKYQDSLKYLGNHFDPQVAVCPCAISFMVGRDGRSKVSTDSCGIDSRLRVLCEELNKNQHREFELIDSFSHRRYGPNETTWGTALGLMKLKSSLKIML